MRVRDLKRGQRFRILQKTYVLHSLSPCAALVEVEAPKREVKIGEDVEFTAPGSRRIHIAPAAEVDELFERVDLGEKKSHTKGARSVGDLEDAEKALRADERKQRAKEKE